MDGSLAGKFQEAVLNDVIYPWRPRTYKQLLKIQSSQYNNFYPVYNGNQSEPQPELDI